MKWNKETKNIYQILKPFYFILNVFGLACYTFDSKTKKLTATPARVIALILALCSWFWILYRLQQDINFEAGMKSKLMYRLWKYQYLFQHILGLVVITFNFAQRTTVGNILESINNFDRHGKRLGWDFKPSLRFYKTIIAQFCVSSILLIIQSVMIWTETPDTMFFHLIDYFFINGFFLVITQQFTISANFIEIRLTALIDNYGYVRVKLEFHKNHVYF